MYRLILTVGIVASLCLSGFSKGSDNTNKDKNTISPQERLSLFNIRIMPIPSKEEIMLSYSLEKLRHINISILNQGGQVMAEKTFDDQSKGSYFFPIDIGQLHTGIYELRLKIDEYLMKEKLVID